jgi:AraC-like DNA-binding protein
MKIQEADPVLHDILVAKAEELAALRGAEGRFVGHVRQTIRNELRIHLPTVETTARALRTTPRALQRRLAAESATFQELVESVRDEVARTMLRDGTSRVMEIAEALKYAGPSAFVRAFKRWTGKTPGEFRDASR